MSITDATEFDIRTLTYKASSVINRADLRPKTPIGLFKSDTLSDTITAVQYLQRVAEHYLPVVLKSGHGNGDLNSDHDYIRFISTAIGAVTNVQNLDWGTSMPQQVATDLFEQNTVLLGYLVLLEPQRMTLSKGVDCLHRNFSIMLQKDQQSAARALARFQNQAVHFTPNERLDPIATNQLDSISERVFDVLQPDWGQPARRLYVPQYIIH
jgi:hypothetical protein